jgi:hypothetical protein
MSRKEYQGLLEVARGQVSFGIYAVEKGDYAELRCDKCSSISQLKNLKRQFKGQGFKVLYNKNCPYKAAAGVAAEGALMSAT